MSRYRFDLTSGYSPMYDGPECPRVVHCEQCNRIMEAPLMAGASVCCIESLHNRLNKWLKEYEDYSGADDMDMALAGMSLDALIYDIKHGYTEDKLYRIDPELGLERDKALNEFLVARLKDRGFEVKMGKDGSFETVHPDLELEDDTMKPWDHDGLV